MKRVCVYCGSSPGFNPLYSEMAQQLGHVLAQKNLGLVYGGSRVGLMGIIADTVLSEGGEVSGVILKDFAPRVAHDRLTRLEIVDSMHERKGRMFDLSDAFIALPGGFGTLDEILEVLTWAQLGIHAKPCGLLNIDGYFNSFVSFLDFTVENGFVKKEHRALLLVADSPEEMLESIVSYRITRTPKWPESGS